jgi:hypothetical protein
MWVDGEVRMNKRLFGALGTVVLGAAVIAGIGTYVASAKNDSRYLAATAAGTMDTPQGKLPHYTLDMSAYPDSMAGSHGASGGPHPNWVSYGPFTNFRVPAHSVITITIKQYDSGSRITNDFFASVHGTLDGAAMINGKSVTSVDSHAVGHTFTLHGLSDAKTQLFVSVPLPSVPDAEVPASGYTKTPNTVTFSFITGGAGDYVWNCEYPCGDGTTARFGGPMSTQGYMSGNFTVVNA